MSFILTHAISPASFSSIIKKRETFFDEQIALTACVSSLSKFVINHDEREKLILETTTTN
jgi:hypothetical protein